MGSRILCWAKEGQIPWTIRRGETISVGPDWNGAREGGGKGNVSSVSKKKKLLKKCLKQTRAAKNTLGELEREQGKRYRLCKGGTRGAEVGVRRGRTGLPSVSGACPDKVTTRHKLT